MKFFEKILETVIGFVNLRATEYIEMELEELEHLFALITLGFLAGYPLIPISTSLKLLPYLEKEIYLMFNRIEYLDDQLGIIGFDIE
ncbi:hypothetical protein EYM_03210 [Ignicoccus islandicus DSM 13165]|uniref:Uncharacterized protein n=1 Tax=Ignicoccus islandicus DSM 13165 TaxID=940295 RepID=A0A0U3E8E8_9CREN|nr:hypothetical protein [Ignicoccus islandicus]ALU11630.1 hypothetical protein EYM_03210 [Ignicoccus islandicus DSM 13165]